MKADIEQLLRDGEGIIRRRDHPRIGQRLDRLRASGELVTLLPGIMTSAQGSDEWKVWLRAGLLWAGRDAVVTRYAAVRLTFWKDCPVNEVSFTSRRPPRRQEGWPVVRATVPPEMMWQLPGLRVTNPSYTAVELASEDDGGDVIDRALRERKATLDEMWAALATMPGRRGNGVRAELLRDSRDQPWSELERKGHRLLRQHRISDWRTNVKVETRNGNYYADVLFAGAKLIVEFDGWEYHNDRESFEKDRRRRNELVLAGYAVLNFTWAQVVEDPDWVIECIMLALAIRTSTSMHQIA